MAIFRVEKTKDYTVMANHHLRNRKLSLKSKGLLSQMLSLPENWDFTLKGLAMINRESIDSIREAVRELEQAGYIARTRERNDKGHLKGTDYTIFERPQFESEGGDVSASACGPDNRQHCVDIPGQHLPKPTSEKPTLENPILDDPTLGKPTQEDPTQEKPTLGYPTLGNPTQLSTYPSSTESSMTEPSSTDLSTTDKQILTPSYPINPSCPAYQHNPFPDPPSQIKPSQHRQTGWDGDGYENPTALRDMVNRNIEYDYIARRHPREQIDEIVDIIVETLCSRRVLLTVAGDDYPAALVKDKLIRLTSAHIEYVIECMGQNTSFIRNIRKYILAALFNASSTIDSYYSAMVRHDQQRDVGLR